MDKISFTNSIGQVINPGDAVVIVTTGYGNSVRICKGIYLGMDFGCVKCSKEIVGNEYRYKLTNDKVGDNFWRALSSISYQDPEYTKKRMAIMDMVEAVKTTKTKTTTLQRNRIFKIAE